MKTNNPHAITTNNTTPQTSLAPIDPKGLQLRQTAEHLTLERLIEQLRQEELDIDTLCKILHHCSELKKQDVAAEKNRVALQIAQQPKRTPLNAGPRFPSRSTPNHPFDDSPDDQQPLDSNHPTPRAASHQNFRQTLRQAVADIYGIYLDIDPKPHAPPQLASSRQPPPARSASEDKSPTPGPHPPTPKSFPHTNPSRAPP